MTGMPELALDLLIKGTVVFGLGWLVAAAMVRWSAASRHAVWAAVCVAALLLPVARVVLPGVAVPWWPIGGSASAAAPADGGPGGEAEVVAAVAGEVTAETSGASGPVAAGIVGLWLIGVLVVAARVVYGWALTRRFARSTTPSEDDRLRARADVVAGWLGVPGVDVRESAADSMPVTWGVRRPIVAVPAASRSWPVARLETMLVHELAHVRRGDAAWQLVAHAVTSLWWMHPLAWMAARSLRVERERACDDVVLAFGARASDYATDLVTLVEECADTRMDVTATLAMARRSQLEGRVMAILNPRTNRNGRTVSATGVVAALMAVMVPLSALRAASAPPVSDPVEPPQALRIGGAIKEPLKIKHVSPVYPDVALSARVQGVVIIEVLIDDTGAVADTKVVRPVALLDDAAVEAVRQWRFAPTHLNGQPVPVVMTVTVSFRLDESGEPVVPAAPVLPPTVTAEPAPPPTWNAGDPPLRIGGNLKEPKKLKHVAPVYPSVAEDAKVQGIVILEVNIDQDGRVAGARVVRSVALLDQAALDAVLQWEFEPTLLNGHPVPVLMTLTVNFTLGE